VWESWSVATTQEFPVHVLVTDLKLPDIDGLAVLERILQIDSKVIGIVMTGYGSIDCAVKAMKAGAFDFLTNRSTTKSSLARSTRLWRRIAVARTCSRRGKPSVSNFGWSSSPARVNRSGACLSLLRRLRTPSPS
jgi:DNA-binding NtrC family response regulator